MVAPRSDVLVVGHGFLGAQRANALAHWGRLAGTVETDRKRAQVARRLGAPVTDELERALDWPNVRAVVVATPHAEHAGQVASALERGLDVLCEKPLAICPEEAHALARLAEKRRARLSVGLDHRRLPPVRDALGLVRTGGLGAVTSVRATIGHRASPEFLQGWHAAPEVSGGGTLIDNGPHALDLVAQLIGGPVALHALMRMGDGQGAAVDMESFVLLQGPDGAIGEVRSSWELEAGYLTLEVRGQRGHLRAETAPWRLFVDGRRAKGYLRERAAARWFQHQYGCARSLAEELLGFLGEGPPPATGREGARLVELVWAARRSAQAPEVAEALV